MSFQLGDIVEFVPGHNMAGDIFTVIGVREDNIVIVGSKEYVPSCLHLNQVATSMADRLLANYRDYISARWAASYNLQYFDNRKFYKVNRRTLLKRIRDQMAQEIYKDGK